VTLAAGPHTRVALSTSSAPGLPLKWLASVADSDATTIRNVQDFTAADILARRLVLTTGGSAMPTRAQILPPGNALLNGYSDARLGYDHQHWHRHRGGMLTKTLPPTELQIPATVTTLLFTQVTSRCVFGCWLMKFGYVETYIFHVSHISCHYFHLTYKYTLF